MTMKTLMERKIGVIVNTDIRKRAAGKVETITAKLDQTLIKGRFDEPIDKAVRQFTHKAGCPVTHNQFHKVITEFVVHIYDKGLNARWMLSGEPLGQAINLLEKHYNSTYGRGYLPLDRTGAEHLFGFFSQCYEQTSLIVTTNLPFADWPQVFAEDERLAGALLDRLTHHVHILEIIADSYRLKSSLEKGKSKEE